MYKLANNLSKEEAMGQIALETFERKTLSFYRYVKIANPTAFRDQLYKEWSSSLINAFGRIYVSQEGINAQMNVPQPHWDAFLANLESHAELTNMPLKVGLNQDHESFWKLTIKIKHQIVADDLPIDSYDITNVGTHLNAEEFNALAESDDAIIVDMRNQYESEIGRFESALCPDVDAFRDALPAVKESLAHAKDKKLLLYCTGGIRCEKASAYLKSEGFENVYQLHGGIINYAHEVKQKNLPSKFKGQNFVFDERRAERITDDVISQCHQCASASDTHVNCANEMCNLLFIQCKNCQEKMSNCCSDKCQAIAMLPESEQIQLRKHQATKPKMFNRQRLATKATV